MLTKAETYRLTAAFSSLAVGCSVYLFDRPKSIYLFSAFPYLSPKHYGLFGTIGQWLPSAVHTYAFILLTVVSLGNSRRIVVNSSIFWLVAGWLFECGQYPAVATRLVNHIPGWFAGVPLLEDLTSYFRHGTFDPMDLFATLVGALAAWATCQLTINVERGHEA